MPLQPTQEEVDVIIRDTIQYYIIQKNPFGFTPVSPLPGEDTITCLYRGEGGSCCGVGRVLSDDQYDMIVKEGLQSSGANEVLSFLARIENPNVNYDDWYAAGRFPLVSSFWGNLQQAHDDAAQLSIDIGMEDSLIALLGALLALGAMHGTRAREGKTFQVKIKMPTPGRPPMWHTVLSWLSEERLRNILDRNPVGENGYAVLSYSTGIASKNFNKVFAFEFGNGDQWDTINGWNRATRTYTRNPL